MINEDFVKSVEKFPWVSEDQKKGYLSLVQEIKKHGLNPPAEVDPRDAFYIQKLHEMHLYWVDTVGEQIIMLQDQIQNILNRISHR